MPFYLSANHMQIWISAGCWNQYLWIPRNGYNSPKGLIFTTLLILKTTTIIKRKIIFLSPSKIFPFNNEKNDQFLILWEKGNNQKIFSYKQLRLIDFDLNKRKIIFKYMGKYFRHFFFFSFALWESHSRAVYFWYAYVFIN